MALSRQYSPRRSLMPCMIRRSACSHGWRSGGGSGGRRSEEHTSELQSLMRISYAVFCLKKKKNTTRGNIYIDYTDQPIIVYTRESTEITSNQALHNTRRPGNTAQNR